MKSSAAVAMRDRGDFSCHVTRESSSKSLRGDLCLIELKTNFFLQQSHLSANGWRERDQQHGRRCSKGGADFGQVTPTTHFYNDPYHMQISCKFHANEPIFFFKEFHFIRINSMKIEGQLKNNLIF